MSRRGHGKRSEDHGKSRGDRGSSQGGHGSTQGGHGSTQGGHGSTQGGHGSTQGGHGSTQGGHGSNQVGHVSIQGGQGSTHGGQGSTHRANVGPWKRRTHGTSTFRKYESTPQKAQHILEITNKKRFAVSFDIVISEIQDVFWANNRPISGSAEAVVEMRKAGKNVKFITSSSSRNEQELLARLKRIGIPETKVSDLVHPIKTMSRFLVQFRQGKSVFSLCSPEVNALLSKSGATILHLANESRLSLSNIREVIKPKDKVATVIADLNFNINYAQLARAQQYLFDPDCNLIVGSFQNDHLVNDALSTFGNTGFINLLRQRTRGEVQLMGKPSRYVGDDIAREYLITDRQRVLFIGGSLMEDIDFANGSGFQSCLVYTGKSKPSEVEHLPESLKPDYVADGITDFADLFSNLRMNL